MKTIVLPLGPFDLPDEDGALIAQIIERGMEGRVIPATAAQRQTINRFCDFLRLRAIATTGAFLA